MPKVTIVPITTTLSNTAANTINNNMEALAVAIENTLSRDGTVPNQMASDIDMNNNDLLNVGLIDAENISLNDQNLQEIIDQVTEAVGQAEASADAAQEAVLEAQAAALEAQQAVEDIDNALIPVFAEIDLKEDKDQKGIAGGYAPIGLDGKIPSEYVPEGGSYLGIWDASTNTPTITAGVGNNGDFYSVSVAGTQSISGSPEDYFVGDQVRFNGGTNTWERIPDNASVLDVAGKTGNVVLVKGDVGLGNVDNTADTAKPVSTAQQTAINARVQRLDNALSADANVPNVGYFTSGQLGVSANSTGSTNYPGGTGITWSFGWVGATRTFDFHKTLADNWYIRGWADASTPNAWKKLLLSTDLGSTVAPIVGGLIPSEYLPASSVTTRFTTPEEFGAVGDGVTNDTAAMVSWFADVCTGKIGILGGPSKNYIISGTALTALNQDVVILGAGSTITATSSSRHFLITNDFTELNNLSGITNMDYAFNGTDNTPVTRVNFSTTGNLANYAVGDIVKVGSNSIVPDEEIADPNPHREGEFAQVGAIDGTGLILTHRLRFTVSGAPRVAKMNTTRRLLIENLVLDHTGFTQSTSWNLARVSINNVYQPTLNNVHSKHSAAQGIQLASCFQAATVNLAVSNARTNTSHSAFGYGLYETSSAYSVHVNPRFTNCRHGYTTVMIGTAAGDNDLSRRGRNQYATIINGVAHGCTSAGFDTHADSFHTSFIGCTVIGARDERFNFQLRGQGDSITDCTSYGPARGALINQINPSNSGQTDYCRISGFVHIGTAADTTSEPAINVRSSSNQVTHILVDNCRFERNGSTAAFLKTEAAVVRVINPQVLGPNSTSGNFFDFVADRDSVITIRGGYGDNTGSHAAASYRPFRADESGTIWDVDGYELIVDNGKLGAIVTAADASGGREIVGHFKNIKSNRTPSAITVIGTQLTNNVWVDVNGGVTFSYNNNFLEETYSTTGNKTLSLSRSGGETVYVSATVSTSGVAINAIGDGAYKGQQLVIRNSSSSSNNLQITSVSGIPLGGNVTLAAGEAIRLYWTGSTWTRA